jgi:hypothetical protein
MDPHLAGQSNSHPGQQAVVKSKTSLSVLTVKVKDNKVLLRRNELGRKISLISLTSGANEGFTHKRNYSAQSEFIDEQYFMIIGNMTH